MKVQRPLAQRSLQVWGVLRAAGPQGLKPPAISAALLQQHGLELGGQALKSVLQTLQTQGYARNVGTADRGQAAYRATAKVPVNWAGPLDEPEVAPAGETAMEPDATANGKTDAAEADDWPRRAPTDIKPAPGTPNSVFALGESLRPTEGEEEPEPEPRAAAPAAPGVATPASPAMLEGLGWRRLSDDETGGEITDPEDDPPAREPSDGVDIDAARGSDSVSVVPAVADNGHEPLFCLYSDGVFVAELGPSEKDVVLFNPRQTRALFRWLDRLGGLQLERLAR